MQQLRKGDSEGQGQENDFASHPSRAHASKGTSSSRSVHRCAENDQVLLRFLRRSLWRCEGSGEGRKKTNLLGGVFRWGAQSFYRVDISLDKSGSG